MSWPNTPENARYNPAPISAAATSAPTARDRRGRGIPRRSTQCPGAASAAIPRTKATATKAKVNSPTPLGMEMPCSTEGLSARRSEGPEET